MFCLNWDSTVIQIPANNSLLMTYFTCTDEFIIKDDIIHTCVYRPFNHRISVGMLKTRHEYQRCKEE